MVDFESETMAAPLDPGSKGYAPPVVGGHYEILAMLGAGAMGTVYRARDRELDEVVALKTLKKELVASAGMLERFRREVKLARRVTHRNVARTFDIGGAEGERYLTMELVDGEVLAAQLARRGRIPPRDVVRIAIDICAGLAAAHSAGVLHRDLKPENVVIAKDGRAVITDFGIARAVEPEPGRTQNGVVVGTPAYMAPEQVEGARDLDGRADLYALGTMVFELLTGKQAWTGDSAFAVAAARLVRPPPDLRAHAPDLPEPLVAIVGKLMARGPADRFASAEEAGSALAALAVSELPSARSLVPAAPVTPRASLRRLAVMPLANLGPVGDGYLAETLTEDLVDLLSVVPELRVRPRGDTMRFDPRKCDVREVGRTLGVDVVVDGSLRRMGEQIRVSVRLVTVDDGFQLWAARFDGPPANVTHVGDAAASAIARALMTERAAEARPVAADPAVEELFLRGRFLVHRGWFDEAREGVRLLRDAHERAPDDARIAGTYALAVARVLTGAGEYVIEAPRARELAERTLRAAPEQTEARLALGVLHLNDAEGAGAAAHLKKALTTNPGAGLALDALGRLLVEVGQTSLGIDYLRRAISADPALARSNLAIARVQALLGDDETALETLGALPAEKNDVPPYALMRGRLALWRHDRSVAAVLQNALGTWTNHPSTRTVLALLERGTLSDDELRAMDDALPLDPAQSPRRNAFHAQIRVELKLGAGLVEPALADLVVADKNGLLDLVWLDRCPLFAPVRTAATFLAVREATAERADRVLRALDR